MTLRITLVWPLVFLIGCASQPKPQDSSQFKADYDRVNRELEEQRAANRQCLAEGKPPEECCKASGGNPILHEGQAACQWSQGVGR